MSLDCNDPDVWHVESSLPISYSYHFVRDCLAPENTCLADLYKPWKRCLVLVDYSVYDLYSARIRAYFKVFGIHAVVHRTCITEETKSFDSLQELCQYMTDFDLIRREPVLVIGGGILTDVAGFACAVYRRTTQYIRVPTSLIGLIDASVSNRVAVNWNGLKNRLGGYHEPLSTVIDPTFLGSLPASEIRNGIAEILKISSCTDLKTFELLQEHGEDLINNAFGQLSDASKDLQAVADQVIREAIRSVLVVEAPNSREQDLNRVMYFGHTWSPILELAVSPPLMHGHAISVDMCYSVSLAHHLGYLSEPDRDRFLSLFSRLGLALDHPAFTIDLMLKATRSTTSTRNGLLRAPIPITGLGAYHILPSVDEKVLSEAWTSHKRTVADYTRKGLAVNPTVDGRLPN